jgi:hypothetical protein
MSNHFTKGERNSHWRRSQTGAKGCANRPAILTSWDRAGIEATTLNRQFAARPPRMKVERELGAGSWIAQLE